MDVFDLQASVKIDTTDANQKLDALIAKAKELNNLLDRPHNINVNGNGGGGGGGTPYSGGGGNGINGYLPGGGSAGLPSGGSGMPFTPIIPVSIPSGGGTPSLPSGWSTPALTGGNTPLLPSAGGTPLLGAGGGGGALIPGVGTVSGGAAAAAGGAEALLNGTTLSAGVAGGLIAGGLAAVGGAVGYFASGMAAENAAKAADLENDVTESLIGSAFKPNPFQWNGLGAMLSGNSWKTPASTSPTYIDVPRQSTASELGRDSSGGLQRRRNVKTGGKAVTDAASGDSFDIWDYMMDVFESGRGSDVHLDSLWDIMDKRGYLNNGILDTMTKSGRGYLLNAMATGKGNSLTLEDWMNNPGKIFNSNAYEHWKEDISVPVTPEVDGDAAASIAAQIGEVDIPVNLSVKYSSYSMMRSFFGDKVSTGTGDAFDASSVAGAVNKLSNKLEHLTIQVGKKTFGRTVVDNSGRSLQNFLGASQQSVAGGYGWR